MRFEYKTLLNPDSRHKIWHDEVKFTPCCDQAAEHHGSWCDHNKDLFLDPEDASVNVGQQPDDYFGGWNSSLEILHCPFCGAKITTEEVERVEVTTKSIQVPTVRQDTVRTEKVVFRK